MEMAKQQVEKSIGKNERIISYSTSQILRSLGNEWCVFACRSRDMSVESGVGVNSSGTIVDTHAILMLEATRTATREQALRFRETLRMQLRTFEDMHGLPHSFQTKAELGQREIDQQRDRSDEPSVYTDS
jgi:hypothetical protein